MFVCVAFLTWDAKIDQLNERATNARNTSWQWSQCSHCADHTNVCEYNIARCKWLPFSHLTSNLPALCLLFLFPPKHEWKIQVPYRFPPLPSTFHLHFFYALHLSKGNSQQNSTEYSRQEEKISLVLNFEKYKKGKTSFHDANCKVKRDTLIFYCFVSWFVFKHCSGVFCFCEKSESRLKKPKSSMKKQYEWKQSELLPVYFENVAIVKTKTKVEVECMDSVCLFSHVRLNIHAQTMNGIDTVKHRRPTERKKKNEFTK